MLFEVPGDCEPGRSRRTWIYCVKRPTYHNNVDPQDRKKMKRMDQR